MVNLSIKQLQQKDFLSSVKQILEETNFDPNYLELEITAVVDQTRHKKGRPATLRNWFYIFICGRFESK